MTYNEEKKSPLKSLQNIFYDRPEVLKLLDPLNLDTERIAGEVVLEEYRTSEGFSSPVNFYVTGRTKAGKTSLGNTIFDGSQNAMKSTGRRDCTDNVGCFQSANNLRYFDLPGAGSSESFENINRAALCVEQIPGRRGRNSIVTEFLVSDYTKYAEKNKPSDTKVTVESWQSDVNQLEYGADVILYVIAPHEGLGRDDENYLFDLLTTQHKKNKNSPCNVIFALNLHLTESGEPKYTAANLEDAEKIISLVYADVYPDERMKPVIIQINSLTGIGANSIAEQICKLLPVNKLGKMEQVLGEKLKDTARKVRSKRFRQALIYIASRLATIKVNESISKQDDLNLVNEAYAAVYSYALKVFKVDDVNKDIYRTINNVANKTTESRVENIIGEEKITRPREIKNTREVAEFVDVEKVDKRTINEVYAKSEKRHWSVQWALGDKQTLENRPKEIELKTFSKEFIGTRQEVIDSQWVEEVVGTKQVILGKEYLKGGYDLIEGILSIGLGVEGKPNDDFAIQFGSSQAKELIGNLKSQIEKIVVSYSSNQAEKQIMEILEKILI